MRIRNEKEADYRKVEEITRKAFWNLYGPGCTEHYLVHIMRTHKDFLPELALVLEVDDQIIGNIMYTKAKLVDTSGEEKEILTFGPVSEMYTGEKVRLREYRREDIPLALQYINDSEVKKFLVPGIPYPYTFEDETKWYEGCIWRWP